MSHVKKRKKRKKRKKGLRLWIAYTLRFIFILIVFLCIFLMICGCLYIAEYLHGNPNNSQNDILSQQEIQTSADMTDFTISSTAPIVEGDAVVVLDAGHGGVQPGCEFDSVLEKDITLSVTLLLKEKLEDMGITVVLTRDSDEDISLSGRVDIANAASADCFVSIHCNSFTEDTGINGFEGYYYQSEDGKNLADSILHTAEKYPINVRNTKEANYQVLRETTIPAVLLEIGYLSNLEERQTLLDEDYQDTISTAISEGIALWLDN